MIGTFKWGCARDIADCNMNQYNYNKLKSSKRKVKQYCRERKKQSQYYCASECTFKFQPARQFKDDYLYQRA